MNEVFSVFRWGINNVLWLNDINVTGAIPISATDSKKDVDLYDHRLLPYTRKLLHYRRRPTTRTTTTPESDEYEDSPPTGAKRQRNESTEITTEAKRTRVTPSRLPERTPLINDKELGVVATVIRERTSLEKADQLIEAYTNVFYHGVRTDGTSFKQE